MLNKFAVDSCKIRIPLEQCEIINTSLLSHWITQEINVETGEVRDGFKDFKGKAYKHSELGISTRCLIENQMTAERTKKEFLTFGINAKMLKSKYAEGLTLNNVKHVYDYLISLKLAYFTFEDFIQAQCTDVDFKFDFKCDSLGELIDKMKSVSQPTKVADRGYRAFQQANNMGIQWSNRHSTALSKPFIKIYSKELDLKNNSSEFYDAYLQGQDFKDVTRVEYTIKNKKHFKSFNVSNTSLEGVLSLSQDKMSAMMQSCMSKHTMKVLRDKKEKGMSAKEQRMVNTIRIMQMGNIGVNEGKSYLLNGLPYKTRKRDSEYFDEVWEKHFSKLPKSKQLNNLEKWLEMVGVQFV